MASQAAWIGLGNMGRGMCKNIVEKGNLIKPLIIYNRTAKRAHDLAKTLPEGKAVVSTDLNEVVTKADVIFTCVGDDAAINEVIDNILKQKVENKLLVDCSTVHPDTTDALEKKITAAGAGFVACPVFGAPPMADAGQLICVVAGPEALCEKVKPFTTGVMGKAMIDFIGQAPRQATHLKIIGNTFIVNMVQTLAEGHVVAEKSGLGSENLQKYIDTMFGGPYSAYSKRMMTGDYYNREEPLFMARLARKDARHALSIAKASDARMRTIELADERLGTVEELKGEKGDLAGIYGVARKESGLEYENK